ncbi:MAG: efflux RND transporter periplasmic adaptor subunit [Desulfarculaceae bacterium]|nr:efflux RND transporter periplasmic adaptor subunit [Desulfarculaceae bacterium]MCF8070753.1 efflux RND transporter periplasmic adaptor subunit [Desulfarculaceae bacterium]MCF8102190.1 efflux RND transporter periplasmic adaptor subunit [Desulfarculaceae bacterium]
MRPKTIRLVGLVAGSLALLLLIAYTGGFLDFGKIGPGRIEAREPAAPAGQEARTKAVELPVNYQAVGTVQPMSEIRVEAQVPGRILAVKTRSGQMVERGQELVKLDDRQYRARLAQARQGMAEARAVLARAKAEHARVAQLLKGQAATPRQMEQATEGLKRAQAMAARAGDLEQEARVALGYTTVSAPASGRVMKRLAEPGDTALPGRPLLLLQAQGGLRLEAVLPEALFSRVRPGQKLQVELPSLERALSGKVQEIVPAADPATRTFLVKVSLPAEQGLYPGVFGRLLVPMDKRKAVLVPARAVSRVGQLEMVLAKQDGRWQKVMVTTGRRQGDMLEALSGLKGGETVLIPAGAHAR